MQNIKLKLGKARFALQSQINYSCPYKLSPWEKLFLRLMSHPKLSGQSLSQLFQEHMGLANLDEILLDQIRFLQGTDLVLEGAPIPRLSESRCGEWTFEHEILNQALRTGQIEQVSYEKTVRLQYDPFTDEYLNRDEHPDQSQECDLCLEPKDPQWTANGIQQFLCKKGIPGLQHQREQIEIKKLSQIKAGNTIYRAETQEIQIKYGTIEFTDPKIQKFAQEHLNWEQVQAFLIEQMLISQVETEMPCEDWKVVKEILRSDSPHQGTLILINGKLSQASGLKLRIPRGSVVTIFDPDHSQENIFDEDKQILYLYCADQFPGEMLAIDRIDLEKGNARILQLGHLSWNWHQSHEVFESLWQRIDQEIPPWIPEFVKNLQGELKRNIDFLFALDYLGYGEQIPSSLALLINNNEFSSQIASLIQVFERTYPPAIPKDKEYPIPPAIPESWFTLIHKILGQHQSRCTWEQFEPIHKKLQQWLMRHFSKIAKNLWKCIPQAQNWDEWIALRQKGKATKIDIPHYILSPAVIVDLQMNYHDLELDNQYEPDRQLLMMLGYEKQLDRKNVLNLEIDAIPMDQETQRLCKNWLNENKAIKNKLNPWQHPLENQILQISQIPIPTPKPATDKQDSKSKEQMNHSANQPDSHAIIEQTCQRPKNKNKNEMKSIGEQLQKKGYTTTNSNSNQGNGHKSKNKGNR